MLVGHDIFGFLYFVPLDSTYFCGCIDRHMYREANSCAPESEHLEVGSRFLFQTSKSSCKQRDRNAQEIAMGKK